MNQLAPVILSRAPALVVAAGRRASYRFLEFFTAQIRNPHTRRAYARAATEFFDFGALDHPSRRPAGKIWASTRRIA